MCCLDAIFVFGVSRKRQFLHLPEFYVVLLQQLVTKTIKWFTNLSNDVFYIIFSLIICMFKICITFIANFYPVFTPEQGTYVAA